jgi:hypothetical protein
VGGSVCCEDLLGGATGCCSTVAGELVLCSDVRTAWSVVYTGLSSQEGGVAQSRSSRKLERREEKVPFSENRNLRPLWCIDPGVPVNCGHGRRSGAAAKTLVVGGGPRTGASARGSSGTCTHGADRARVGAPLRELREIRSGGSGANPKGACGEQYERLCLSGGHESGEEDGRRLEARLASRR